MATQSKKVLLNASVLFAFLDRAHPKHEEAAAYIRFFAQEEYQVYIDIISLNEAYKKIYSDISPSLAKDFLRISFLSNINFVYPEEADTRAAQKVLASTQTTDMTLEQALILVIANRRNISQICTFEYLHQLFGIVPFYLPM